MTVETAVEQLGHAYAFRGSAGRTRVQHFIEGCPALTAVLMDASDTLQRIFPERRYTLDVRRDPDIDDEQLVLSIGVKRDPAAPRDGVRRLLELQETWGLEADRRTEGRITVVLESL